MDSLEIKTKALDILQAQVSYSVQSIPNRKVSISVDELLREGLSQAKQGHYAEGAILLTLVRDHLTPDLSHLTSLLDTIIQQYKELCSVQQTLQEVNTRFTKAQTALQTKIADLENLLLTPPDEAAAMPTLPIPASHSTSEDNNTLPALLITCFGQFEVKRLGEPVVLCANRNGQAILRYLITRSKYRATKDKIISAFWPEEAPEVALHRLRVAISALRRSLNSGYEYHYGGGYILCKAETYQMNPAVTIHTDVDEFRAEYLAGQEHTESDAVTHYETACGLYRGPFLPEDIYADWSFPMREQLSHTYIKMCSILTDHFLAKKNAEAAIKWATAALHENPCDETIYRQLMCAYTLQGRRDEALRQYQACVQILARELEISPTPETVHLYQLILNNQHPLAERTSLELK